MPSSPKPWSFSTYTDADGRTYVYSYRNRWDPEKKQSRIEKRCHVGRLDPQTGQVHLGRKFLTNNPEYAGKFWLYDNNSSLNKSRSSSRIRTTNRSRLGAEKMSNWG